MGNKSRYKKWSRSTSFYRYQGASKHNSLEEFVCICIMFLHLWLVYCLLNADFIMCIIHTKSFDGQVVNRLQAMEQDLVRLHPGTKDNCKLYLYHGIIY